MNAGDASKGVPQPTPYAAGSAPAYGFNPPPYSTSPIPPPPQPTVTVIQTSAIIPLGPDSAHIVCPSCRATVSTRVDHETTTKTHMICLIMCIFALWPCCLFPYCMDSCKNTNHYCPACGAFLGEYKR